MDPLGRLRDSRKRQQKRLYRVRSEAKLRRLKLRAGKLARVFENREIRDGERTRNTYQSVLSARYCPGHNLFPRCGEILHRKYGSLCRYKFVFAKRKCPVVRIGFDERLILAEVS